MSVFAGLFGIILFAILAVLGLALYFLPAILAKQNGHPSFGGIFVLNLLLGWSLLGWIGALVWALSKPQPVVIVQGPAVYAQQGYPQPQYPHMQPGYPQPGYAPQGYAAQPQSYANQPQGYVTQPQGQAAPAYPPAFPAAASTESADPFARPEQPGPDAV